MTLIWAGPQNNLQDKYSFHYGLLNFSIAPLSHLQNSINGYQNQIS